MWEVAVFVSVKKLLVVAVCVGTSLNTLFLFSYDPDVSCSIFGFRSPQMHHHHYVYLQILCCQYVPIIHAGVISKEGHYVLWKC